MSVDTARVFRKGRYGQFSLVGAVIIGAQARAAVAHEVLEGQEVPPPPNKKKVVTTPKFGDTVIAFASSRRRCGQRTCRVPSLVR